MTAYEHGLSLQRYQDFAPTGFDSKGLNADYMGDSDDPEDPGRGDWIVAPVGHNRDSEILQESNWTAALEALGGESATVEVHRFGHWGPGWFEIILVNPRDAARVAVLGELACRLEDYPVLDDEDHSRREYEAQIEGIEQQAGHWVRDGAPKNWPSRVFRALGEDAYGYTDPGGGGPDDRTMRKVLKRLKLSAPRYVRVRTLALRQVKRAGGWPAMYRDIHVRRGNPEYPW